MTIRTEALRTDVRAAARATTRAPTQTVAAVVVVALALAGLTTMTGLLNALVFRQLAVVRQPSDLVSFSLIGSSGRRTNVSWPAIPALAGQSKTLSGLCGVATGLLLPVETSGSIALEPTTLLTPNCFRLLGVNAYAGRLLTEADDPPVGPARVVVLGYGYWRRQFGGAANVIGQTLTLHGARLAIVGVTPPGFTGLGVEVDADILLPVKYEQTGAPDPKRPHGVMFTVGRLRPGATVEAARAELTALWPGVREATMPPGQTAAQAHDSRAVHVDVEAFATGFSTLRDRYAEPLKVLTAISTVLLVIACATLSGLFLSQTISRQQEFATRSALGASRADLACQALLEAMVPTMLGATLAVPLSWWLRHAISATIWTGLSAVTWSLAPDWRTVGTTVVGALVAGFTIGLAPALTVALARHQLSANARTVSRSTRRLGGVVFIAQVAISAPLVFCAGLLALSAWRLTHVDLGFRDDHVLEARLLPRDNGYAGMDVPSYYQDLAAHLTRLPGVRSVAYSHVFPSGIITPEIVAPAESAPGADEVSVAFEIVSPKFFDTAGISLQEGREFTGADTTGAKPVVIITRRLATRLFPQGALGQRLRIGLDPARANVEVVGVSGDPRLGDVREPPTPAVFRPLNQELALAKQPNVLVQTVGDPRALEGPLNQTLAALHREYTAQPIPVTALIGNSVLQERVMAIMASILGGFVLMLAFAGLFALLMHRVRRRVPELSVRLALGASPSTVQWLVSGEALRLVGLGLAIGIPLALLAGRLTQAVLFDLKASNLATLVATTAIFVTVAAIAAILPARRAATVDPSQSLRTF
jgi:putative ABC transport system permease protein